MTAFAIIALIAALAIQLADIVTTQIVLGYGGHEVGLARIFVKAGLPTWLWPWLVKSVFAIAAWLAFRYSGENALLSFLGAISAVTLYGVWHNLGQIRQHYADL